MDSITIDELKNIILAYDKIGQEYYVWDKTNNKWFWLKTLGEARNTFSRLTNGKA